MATVWLVVVASTLWLDAQLSPDIPKVDDWANFVPVLADPHLATPAWLWSQTFDHRIPLARMGYLATYYALGHDFRGGSFLGTVLLGLTALFGMIAARRVRGHSSVADVFFPLMMLHWGQAQNCIIGTGLHFNLTYVFYYPALFLLLLPAETFTVRRAVLWTLLVLGLPLCGMMGVVLAVPLACVLLILGVARFLGTAEDRRSGACFLLLGLAVVALIGFYFKDYVPPAAQADQQAETAARGLSGQLATAAIILSMSLGWLGWESWPLASFLLIGVGVATAGVLMHVWYRQPGERWRAGGVLAFLLGTAALIAGTGRARAWLYPEGVWFCTRYAVFSIPVVVFAYLVCVRYASTRFGSRIQGALAALAAVVFCGSVLGAGGYPHATTALSAARHGARIHSAGRGGNGAEGRGAPGLVLGGRAGHVRLRQRDAGTSPGIVRSAAGASQRVRGLVAGRGSSFADRQPGRGALPSVLAGRCKATAAAGTPTLERPRFASPVRRDGNGSCAWNCTRSSCPARSSVSASVFG